jgi:AraC-like DNA-binding protein
VSATSADLARFTRYDRRDRAFGVVSWVYEYWNPEPIDHGGLANGLELGVQLRGEWLHHGSIGGRGLFGPKSAHHMNLGETFGVRFDGRADPGLQVGFAIYPQEMPEYADLAEELRFRPSRSVDARFYELCRWIHRDADARSDEVRREVVAYLERSCELAPRDPLDLAKRELERYFARELFVGHLAEAAQMHPVTFARKFKRRFGLTPATYRVRFRLHHAGRLLWSRPDLSIEGVANESGFNELPYFYRLFRTAFRVTPGAYRARAMSVTAPSEARH